MDLINLDPPPVSRDCALELMVHHLQLAHMYYQATPENRDEVRAEVERLLRETRTTHMTRWRDDGGLGGPETVPVVYDSPEIAASLSFLDILAARYEEMRAEDEG